jgi:transposase
MLPIALQQKTIDKDVLDYFTGYIKNIETNYEQQIQTLTSNIIELKEYQFKYDELKEKYDLLVYRRFARSAEQLLADEKQQMLFTSEAERQVEETETKPEELQTVKSFKRRNGGRKPLSSSLQRRERTIDIPESEKKCACGADLKKFGEETSEKLIINEPEIYVDRAIRPKYACRCC